MNVAITHTTSATGLIVRVMSVLSANEKHNDDEEVELDHRAARPLILFAP